MVAGHLQTKKGYYYMVLNLKSEDGNRNRDTGNREEKCKVGGRNVSRNQMHL